MPTQITNISILSEILFFKIFWKVGLVYFLDTLEVENLDEIALSLTVKEIAYILRFYIFGENLKIQNDRHFWKFFEKWA